MESIELKVVRTDQQSRKFYVDFNGATWGVKQVPEQYGQDPPATITCVVKYTGKKTHLEQDYNVLLSKHYHVGQEQIFEIVRANNDYYELRDAWGYVAYAEREYAIDIIATPKARCRILQISGKHPDVKILEPLAPEVEGMTIHKPFFEERLKMPAEMKESFLDMMLNNGFSEGFDLKVMGWLKKWQNELTESDETLPSLKESCRAILEESEYIRQLPKDERKIIVSHLVSVIENCEYFNFAWSEQISENAKEFVEGIIHKLKTSGLLYHPREQFQQMMFLFLLDKDLMERYARDLFETIRSKDMRFWQDEGLAAQWISMLEYYCHNSNDDASQFSMEQHKENVIQALSLQQGLFDDGDLPLSLFDPRRNRAMLYRHASEMEVQRPSQMLDIAFKNLVGITESSTVPNLRTTTDSKLLANMLYNRYTPDDDTPLVPQKYQGAQASLYITDESIFVAPNNCMLSTTENAIPSTMHLWRDLQVCVPNRIKEKTTDSLNRTADVWNEIEQQVFSREATTERTRLVKKEYETGQLVNFVVRKQLSSVLFACDIIDGNYRTPATLNVNNIVKYHLTGLTIDAFYSEEGMAKILAGEIMRQDEEGRYQITMFNNVIQHIAHRHSTEYEMEPDYLVTCRVYLYNESLKRYIGVDELGFPVSVVVEDEETPWSLFAPGVTIEARVTNESVINGFVWCKYFGTCSDVALPSIVDCFAQLMTICCDDNYLSVEDEESTQLENNEDMVPMPATQVEELISIIEQQAVLEKDYIKSYNYLAFCRLLARIINSDDKVEYFKSRLTLISMLNRFNDTGNVDTVKLSEIEGANPQLFQRQPQLKHNLYQLKLVSHLGKTESFDTLTQLRNNAQEDSLVKLANLVIAHNLLKDAGSEKETKAISEQIQDLLRLQRKVTNKKYYGEESQTVEFKTSMVFPPDENMQANLRKQTNEILQQICAFLNCGGGTLYLGVLDSGYESGLSEDLKYAEFKGNKDKYTRHLTESVYNKLGDNAARCVHYDWDRDAELEVMVVTVDECMYAISLDDEYYERIGTSVHKIRDKEEFLKYRQNQIDVKQGRRTIEPRILEKSNKVEKKAETVNAEQKAIETSLLRNNVLHNYEDDYVDDIVGYLRFLTKDKYEVKSMDCYDELELQGVIAIHESEVRDYLICAYEDGHVVKVPMSEILDKMDRQAYNILTDSPLKFVCPASDNDALMSVLTSSKSERYIRFDEVSIIEEGKMGEMGDLITNTPFQDSIQFDVVPTSILNEHDIIMNHKKSIGAYTKTGEGARGVLLMTQIGLKVNC